MAEALAAIGVVASILQLVQFGSKLVERLDDFVASTKDVPETFLNINTQLPIAISTLQRLRARVERDELLESESKALKALVDRSLGLTKDVSGVLEKVVPPKTASSFEKRLLAIRSLKFDKTVQNASAQLLQNVNLLTFFQTAQIQESTASVAKKLGSVNTSSTLQADFFHHGLNLGGAPRLADGNFVGRDAEMANLSDMLNPGSTRQNVVAVVGMGGIGKTQLCVEYAVNNQDKYTSIFWFNALDESSLRADIMTVAEIILPDETSMVKSRADEIALIQKVRRWFSSPDNGKWLMVFDNVDNPKMPGNIDPAAIDIKNYFPYRSQGSILITTRSRKITFAKQLDLQKFDKAEQGLEILATRCGRTFDDDRDAIELVNRLDGLPLALASAASFLERTSCTAREYLDEYERTWLEEDSDNLLEYGDRTLFTTWNMSYDKIKSQSSEAAEILRILAFFGSENIEYDLLAAQGSKLWPGLKDCLRNKAAFHRSMGKLRDYSLIETSGRSYRLHPCLHDWTLLSLNQDIQTVDVWRALNCMVYAAVAGSSMWSTNYDEALSRLVSHALRLTSPQLFEVLMNTKLDQWHAVALAGLGQLLHRAGRHNEAMRILTWCLDWSQEHLAEDHQDTLSACNVIGLVHEESGNYTNAIAPLQKAAFGFARTLGRYHKKTLDPVHNLGLSYRNLGMFNEAEEMYIWSLRGCEESYGQNDPNTFWAVMALADFYLAKGDFDQAKKEFQRALDGFDAIIDHDHSFARFTATRLGAIHRHQGEYDKAAVMYERVYQSCLKLLGPEHFATQEAKSDLDSLEVLSRLSVDAAHHVSEPEATRSLLLHQSIADVSEVSTIDSCGNLGFDPETTKLNVRPNELHDRRNETKAAIRQESNQESLKSGQNLNECSMSKMKNLASAQKGEEQDTLRCSKCKTALTPQTERFICCICSDHEVCGKCHLALRSTPPKYERNAAKNEKSINDHVFIRCEDTPLTLPQNAKSNRIIIGVDYGTTYTGVAHITAPTGFSPISVDSARNTYIEKWGKVPSVISYQPPKHEQQWGSDISSNALTMINTKLELDCQDSRLDELELVLQMLEGTKGSKSGNK